MKGKTTNAPSLRQSKKCDKIKTEVKNMATSSITKNFVISGTEQVETFLKAIEESEKDKISYEKNVGSQLKSIEELKLLMNLRKKMVAVNGK